MKYIIETPSKIYNGTTAGLRFTNGRAETDSKEIRDVLVNDFGYADVTPAAEEKKAEDKPARKDSAK
jgi:hypothetical protein